MAPIPRPTIDAIYALYQRRNDDEKPRGYLGCSEIGRDCSRRLWLQFRDAERPVFDGRTLKLFNTGKREEERVIADLRAIGVEVIDRDEDGKQVGFEACSGHFRGHVDGIAKGFPEAPETWHVLEIKTHNAKSFAKLEKDGAQKSKPEHWAQMQVYMGLAELDRALYFAVCKDTDELYVERIRFDSTAFKALLLKAKRIVESESPPEKISEDPTSFACKFCPVVAVCSGAKTPRMSCRTCVHSKPIESGAWACGLDHDNSMGGCPEHVYLPDLLPWAEPIDGDPTWIRYKRRDNGREFVNAAESALPALDLPTWGSDEIASADPRAIADPAVETARHVLDGKVTT